MGGFVVLLIIIGVAAVAAVGIYNSLIIARNRCDNSWSQVDVQLRRRYDLIPNLVETVKGYAKHEREVFEKVTQARASAINAGTVKDQAQAENMLSGALKSLFAVAEDYPDLKANQNFLMLQEELIGHREQDRLRPPVLQRHGHEVQPEAAGLPLQHHRQHVQLQGKGILRDRRARGQRTRKGELLRARGHEPILPDRCPVPAARSPREA